MPTVQIFRYSTIACRLSSVKPSQTEASVNQRGKARNVSIV